MDNEDEKTEKTEKTVTRLAGEMDLVKIAYDLRDALNSICMDKNTSADIKYESQYVFSALASALTSWEQYYNDIVDDNIRLDFLMGLKGYVIEGQRVAKHNAMNGSQNG